MSSADPFSSRFEVFGREPKHVVSDINQQAFQRLKELLEVEEGGDGRVIVLRAPRAGFGKTFLLQRITKEYSETHHFVRVNLANGRTTDAAHVLEYVLQALCKVLPDSTTLTELDFLARKILALGLEPLVASGEVPCQDRDGALVALREQPTETFDFHHDRAVTAHWTKSNFEILGPRLAAELARVSGASLREASYWVELLFRFATTAPDNVERARLLFETVFRGDLQNQSESAAEERLHGLLCMLGAVTSMVLIVDDTEGLSTHPPDALALASFLTNLSHCCYGSVVLLSVNDDIWNSAFQPLLPGGLADRLCETTVTLKPLTKEQAEALITTRAGDRSAELLSKISWPDGDLYPRHVLKLASDAWSELTPVEEPATIPVISENDPVVPLTPSAPEEPEVFDSEIEDSFVSSPPPEEKKEEEPARLEPAPEPSPAATAVASFQDSPNAISTPAPVEPKEPVESEKKPAEGDPFAVGLDTNETGERSDVPGEKESAAASAELQTAASQIGEPVSESAEEREDSNSFDAAPSIAPSETVPNFEAVTPTSSEPAFPISREPDSPSGGEGNPLGNATPIRPIEADASLAPEGNPFLAPGVSAGFSSFGDDTKAPGSSEPNPFTAPAGPPPSNFLPPSLTQESAPSAPLSSLEGEGNPFGAVPDSNPFQSLVEASEAPDSKIETESSPAAPASRDLESSPISEPPIPASSPLSNGGLQSAGEGSPSEEKIQPANPAEPTPTSSPLAAADSPNDGLAAFVAAFQEQTPSPEPTSREPKPELIEQASSPFTPAPNTEEPPVSETPSPFIPTESPESPRATPEPTAEIAPAASTPAESPFSPSIPPISNLSAPPIPDLDAPPIPSEHQFGEIGEQEPTLETARPSESPFSPVSSPPAAPSNPLTAAPITPQSATPPEPATVIEPEKPTAPINPTPAASTPFAPVGETPSTPAESPFVAPPTSTPVAPVSTPTPEQVQPQSAEPSPFEAGSPPPPGTSPNLAAPESERPFEAASTPSPFSAVGTPPSALEGPPASTQPSAGAGLNPHEQDKVDELLKQFKERYGRK